MEVSIIIPMYQTEKYIKTCLISILRQTYKNFELIIINDGSTDNSETIARDILEKSSVKWKIIRQENQGQAVARNKGIQAASGKFIIFIDSDDTVDDTFIEQLYFTARNTEVDFAFCNYTFVKRPNLERKCLVKAKLLYRDEMIRDFLYQKKQLIITGVILKKDYIIQNQLYFNSESRFSEDLIYLWKLIYSSKKCAWIDQQLYYYFVHPNSIMTSSKYINILNGYKQFCLLTDELKKLYPELIDRTKLIMPRWEIGCLYSAAHILTYEEFRTLSLQLNYKKIFNELYKFKDAKVFFSALILKMNLLTFYKIARFM